MEKPKSITQLSKEQLEGMCLNLMHVDKVKTEMINQLETNRDEVLTLLEYYLIGNMKYRDSQKQFEKMKSILERGKE